MPWTWLIWELGVFLAALRLLRVIGVTRDTAPSGAEFFACVAAADIVVASTLATAFSFARVNHPAVYVGTAAVLIVVCLVRTGRFPTRGRNGIETIVRMVILQLSPTIIELALIVGANLLGYGSPLTPVHILMVNMITDALPSLAVVLQAPEPGSPKSQLYWVPS